MKSHLLLLVILTTILTPPLAGETKVSHSFLTLGGKTAIIGEDGTTLWEYKGRTRDGFVLPNGNLLLAWATRVEEVTRDKQVVFSYDLDVF